MKAISLFLKVLQKILRIIIYKYESLYYRFFYSNPKLEKEYKPRIYLLFGGKFSKNIADIYSCLFNSKINKKIKEADLICEHFFDLLGSKSKKLGPDGKGYQSIDWHADFKSGYRWNPKTFFRYIPYGHIEGIDIKVPWELSRFHHLIILGQVYCLTGNKKYIEEFSNQVTDWILYNPVGFGVNWKSTMDVAIRAINWLVAMEFFTNNIFFSNSFLKKFYISIYEHGKFIRKHLEYSSKLTTNHYLSNLTGLFFIATYCPFYRESREWQEFAIQELHNEIEKQVYQDGCDFEASTSYHRLVLEMFFYSELLAQRAGITFSENYKNKLKKMFEFSLYCIKPDGMSPQIGDNDNGRLFKFSNRPVLEHKYLINFAAVYFNDNNFKLKQFNLDEDTFWIFGESARTIWDNLSFREDLLKPKSFQNAGWYIIRHNNDYCFITCGPNGQSGKGGHAHNDKLSFELMLDGKDVIIDPGSYIYTSCPKERNKFRSTEYHNTIKFDGYEQNEIPEQGIFSLPDNVKITNAELVEMEDKIFFQGEIRYADITHKRTITLYKEYSKWHITDSFSCSNKINAKMLFHLSPKVTIEGNTILINSTKDKIASIEVEKYDLKKSDYDYSPEYGVKTKAHCLVADIPFTNGIEILNTHIYKR